MDFNKIKDDINKNNDYKTQRAGESKSFQKEPQSAEEKVKGRCSPRNLVTGHPRGTDMGHMNPELL